MDALIASRFLFPRLVVAVKLHAQLVGQFNPSQSKYCLDYDVERLADQLQDWSQLGRYYQDDVRLEAEPPATGRVIVLGDSITDFWNLQNFFPRKPYINRSIGGQTTAQMLARLIQDAIDLHPAAVILLAGTNDVARSTGPETAKMVQDNIEAITELAGAHHIEVTLCSLTPVTNYTSYQQASQCLPLQILQLNTWIKSYAAEAHARFCDYYSALVDAKGMLKNGDSGDGLHHNDRGYALLAPIAGDAIERPCPGSR